MIRLIFGLFFLLSLLVSGCGIDESKDASISVDTAKCISCGKCENTCPFDAIHLVGAERKPVIDPSKCTECGRCVKVCPTDTLTGGE